MIFIKKFICGTSSNLAFDINDDIYGWGHNYNGQLGLPEKFDTKEFIEPRKLPYKFKKIYPGAIAYYAIDHLDNAYSWGYGLDGRLGLGDEIDRYQPTKIGYKFKKFLYCHSTCFARGINGETYCWGSTHHNSLSFKSVNECIFMPFKLKYKFRRVQSGLYVYFARDEDNKLYCWGCNGRGQLGIGEKMGYNDEIILPITKFKHSVNFKKIKLTDWTIFAKNADDIWSHCWGYNYHGELGLGDTIDRNIPHKMNHSFVDIITYDVAVYGIDKQKNTYYWGYSDCNVITIPCLLNYKFDHIFMGREFTVALDADNNIFINEHDGFSSDRSKFKKESEFVKIIPSDYSIAINHSNEIYYKGYTWISHEEFIKLKSIKFGNDEYFKKNLKKNNNKYVDTIIITSQYTWQ